MMNHKNKLTDKELEKVTGGMTWEEIVEASKSWLPEGDVVCKNSFCGKSFNAKDNAFGFMNETNADGMTTTFAIAKCPFCGSFWSVS